MFNPLELHPPKAKPHSIHGRINSHKMLKLIAKWLETNKVKVYDRPDWDQPSDGQTNHKFHYRPNSTSKGE